MQHKLVKNFDWQSTEGQSLLRMKYDLYSEYLRQDNKDSAQVDEAFLNQAILIAYRKGRLEIYHSEEEMKNEVIGRLIYELQSIKDFGYSD